MNATPEILTADQNPRTPPPPSPSPELLTFPSKINLNPKTENKKKHESEEESSSPSSSPSTSDSESDFFQIHPTESISPAIQSMGRDPKNRIPSSVFSGSPMTPTDWSAASNESMFSIRMAGASFSREQMALMVISPEMDEEEEEEEEEAVAAKVNAEAMREVMSAAAEGKAMSERRVMLGRTVSRRSDGSTTSFAFPILTGDGRVGSIKVNFEHQLNSQIKPSKIFADDSPTAMMSSHHPASVQSRWFPCFSCRRFCCC